MLDLAPDRMKMVDRQLTRRGVRDSHVLDAMREVPREAFVPEGLQEFAYEDTPLPIEAGQKLMQALRGRLSGLALPTYVLDIPGGHGKVPIGPSYLEPIPEGWHVTDYCGDVHAYRED